jgi:hypothetical protein
MTVGELIAWCAPDTMDRYMRHMGDIWFEEACFNQIRLSHQLQLEIESLHQLLAEYDEQHQE